MLTDYSRSEHVFDQTADGMVRPALALLYKSALESQSSRERNLFLRRMGDLALFIAGLFADSLRRGPVDVDYYIAMGGGAYGSLCKAPSESARSRALSEVFEDLACNFVHFVDLIGEVGEQARDDLERDISRLHELWRRTGSQRLERKLRDLGIAPGRAFVLH